MTGSGWRPAVLALLAFWPVSLHGGWMSVDESSWLISVAPWEPHTGSIAVPFSNGSVLLLGGQAGEHGGALFDCFNCTSEVWLFDPAAEARKEQSWTNLSEAVPWDPRWGHSAVIDQEDTVWLLFGCCEKGQPTVMLRDVWTYNPMKGVPWTKMTTDPPFEGIQATSVVVRGEDLWVCGGWSQFRGTMSQVATLSMKTMQWTVKSHHGEAPWKHRADHATALSPDGRWLFVYGGQHLENHTQRWSRLKDTWRVSLPEARVTDWQQLGDLNVARSSVPVLLLPSGWLLALGGHFVPDDEKLKVPQSDSQGMIQHHRTKEFRVHNDVLALDLRSDSSPLAGWRVVEPKAPWPARDDCAGVVTREGGVVIFGGGTLYGGGGYLKDVWYLPDPAKYYRLLENAQKGEEL